MERAFKILLMNIQILLSKLLNWLFDIFNFLGGVSNDSTQTIESFFIDSKEVVGAFFLIFGLSSMLIFIILLVVAFRSMVGTQGRNGVKSPLKAMGQSLWGVILTFITILCFGVGISFSNFFLKTINNEIFGDSDRTPGESITAQIFEIGMGTDTLTWEMIDSRLGVEYGGVWLPDFVFDPSNSSIIDVIFYVKLYDVNGKLDVKRMYGENPSEEIIRKQAPLELHFDQSELLYELNQYWASPFKEVFLSENPSENLIRSKILFLLSKNILFHQTKNGDLFLRLDTTGIVNNGVDGWYSQDGIQAENYFEASKLDDVTDRHQFYIPVSQVKFYQEPTEKEPALENRYQHDAWLATTENNKRIAHLQPIDLSYGGGSYLGGVPFDVNTDTVLTIFGTFGSGGTFDIFVTGKQVKPGKVNIDSYDPFIPLVAIFFVLFTIVVSLLGLVRRLFDLVFLVFALPFVTATLPLDDGARFQKWRETAIGKVLLVYGTILAVNIFVIFAGLISTNEFRQILPGGGVDFTGQVIKLLLIIGGALSISGGSMLVARLLGTDASEFREAMGAGSQVAGTVASGVGLAKAALQKGKQVLAGGSQLSQKARAAIPGLGGGSGSGTGTGGSPAQSSGGTATGGTAYRGRQFGGAFGLMGAGVNKLAALIGGKNALSGVNEKGYSKSLTGRLEQAVRTPLAAVGAGLSAVVAGGGIVGLAKNAKKKRQEARSFLDDYAAGKYKDLPINGEKTPGYRKDPFVRNDFGKQTVDEKGRYQYTDEYKDWAKMNQGSYTGAMNAKKDSEKQALEKKNERDAEVGKEVEKMRRQQEAKKFIAAENAEKLAANKPAGEKKPSTTTDSTKKPATNAKDRDVKKKTPKKK